jgi:hypothetical protein
MSVSPQANPQDTESSPGAGTSCANITSNEDPSITTLLFRSAGFDPLTDKIRGRAPQPATPCIELKI